MSGSKKQVTRFVIEGRFLEAVGKSPFKPKYLRISTAEEEQLLKVSKELRPLIVNELPLGSWVTISGKETYNWKKGTRKRKIQDIQPHNPETAATAPTIASANTSAATTATTPSPTPQKKKDKKDKILICQKSSCCKRGGKAVYQAAVDTIEKHDLHDQVQVKPSGCMDKCKKGPCVVMQADKSRHLGVQPEQVEALITEKYAVTA